jgi:hypothetical protein
MGPVFDFDGKTNESGSGGNQVSSEQSKRCGKKDEATQTGVEIWWRCR